MDDGSLIQEGSSVRVCLADSHNLIGETWLINCLFPPSRCLLHITNVTIPDYYGFSLFIMSCLSLFSFLQDKDSHYMDKKESGKEISEEVTRESLIAISYCQPEKDLSIESAPENSNDENVVKSVNSDTRDKYRSELISLSYAESPDTEVQPVSPGEFIKG